MFLSATMRVWNDYTNAYSYGIDLIKFKTDVFRSDVTEDYKINIFEDADEYNNYPEGKIDAINEVTEDGVELDAWFICTSEDINYGSVSAFYTSFYNVGIVDSSYEYSVHYKYNNWSQCVASHAKTQTSALFLIAEVDNESKVYIKVFEVDFETGEYYIGTSEPFPSLIYDFNYAYYTVGAQFLEDEDGNYVDTILFGTSYGLDDSTTLAWPLGFVTSV